MSRVSGADWTLTFDADVIDVTPCSEPDPDWAYTDPQGHVHAWVDGALPTVKSVVVGVYWCPGCHEQHEDVETQCRQCDAPVEPGTRVPLHPYYARGHITISGTLAASHRSYAALMEVGSLERLTLDRLTVVGVRLSVGDEREARFIAESASYA
jgi:hypothetical protein